ncbi:hypothetical protein [Daejeonella oryzae]|uniref:hypothetical protein n=1 Tax=Daejeonella oryzae TaxID=1122943 RepID=UPI0012DEE8C0|nr:hypothetical protein [Daejeonella oryzae]
MKKIYISFLTAACLFISGLATAQQFASQSTSDLRMKLPSGDGSRAQNVFVEVGGQGLLFTANYDSRFGNRRDGLGGRVGIGYISADGDNATTIPVSLNYLLGKGKHFFEIGLGATVLATGGDEDSFLFDDNNSNVIGTMSFSYRLQPVDGGFSFRAGLTPIFNGDFFLPYYGGLSLGYTF